MASKTGNFKGKYKDRSDIMGDVETEDYTKEYYNRVVKPRNAKLAARATNHRMPWSNEEDKELMRLDKKGHTYGGIAYKLERTQASVAQRKLFLKREGRWS